MTRRVEALRQILERSPGDSLARYGLAMEHLKSGEYEEAVSEFRILLSRVPTYLYAYFHAGQCLEKLGRRKEARKLFAEGVEAARRKGDQHALAELMAALDQLSDTDDAGATSAT